MSLLARLAARRPLLPRPLRMALAAVCLGSALALLAAQGAPAPAQGPGVEPGVPGRGPADEPDPGGERQGEPGVQLPPGVSRSQLEREGQALYAENCSSCHGEDLRGIPGRAPRLRGVGEISADFYVRTGRMPLADPEDQPRRAESPFTARQIDALVAYVGSFGGPKVPEVHAEKGKIVEGFELFSDKCMGCHQVVGQGGIVTRGVVPDLQVSEPIDVAEAVAIGPYLMPHFKGQLDQAEIDSLARYVEYTEDPEDRGGWGIGHIGPIPEGMVTWLLALFGLVLTIRLIGERTTE